MTDMFGLPGVQVRGGKFWKMYKRPGQRVIINGDGDLIVRPSFIEASVQRQPGGSSVAQHLLTAYHKSFLAVIKAQFSTKGFQGGRQVRFVFALVEDTISIALDRIVNPSSRYHPTYFRSTSSPCRGSCIYPEPYPHPTPNLALAPRRAFCAWWHQQGCSKCWTSPA